MKIRYIEYGKIFLTSARGALEYSPLDRSDNEIISNTKKFYLNEIATFGTKSSTQDPDGPNDHKVAFALIPWDEIHILFMQVQQRREDEFVDKTNFTSESRRAFNQGRFVFISRAEIEKYILKQVGLASTLIYENPKYPGQARLPDYIFPERGKIHSPKFEPKRISPILTSDQRMLFSNIVNALFDQSQPSKDPNGSPSNRLPKPLFVIKPEMEIEEKIVFFDAMQYWLYPALGIITFASSYITNRQATLFLCEEYTFTGQVDEDRVVDETKLLNDRFEDYYGAVSSLSPEELYHETLAYYLRIDLTPDIAVRIFRLIETKYPFTEEEAFDIFVPFFEVIRKEDVKKIIQRRFNLVRRALLVLLTRIPPPQRIELLLEILDHIQGDLAEYTPFHLAAVTGLDVQSKDAKDIRVLLGTAVNRNQSESLDRIQESLRSEIYSELLLTDYELAGADISSHAETKLRFAATVENTYDQLLLQALMERSETAFFDLVFESNDSESKTYLLSEIVKGLEKNWCKWDIKTVTKIWMTIPEKTQSAFLSVLHYILKLSLEFDNPINNPSEIQTVLFDGRTIFQKRHTEISPRKVEKEPEVSSGSLLNALSSIQDLNITTSLRRMCINVSHPLSDANIHFAYWWLMQELAYTKEEILGRDYLEMVDHYQNKAILDFPQIPGEYIFILSGGKHGNSPSLRECIDKELHYLVHDYLYTRLLAIWSEQEFTIPTADVEHLVKRLPDNISRSILKSIILSKSKEQSIEITKLDPQTAINWLVHTEASRILNSKDRDILFDTLLNLTNPTPLFIRYMLMFDPTAYGSTSSWKDYSSRIRRIYQNHWKDTVPDPVTEEYINFISHLHSPINISKFQNLVMKLIGYPLDEDKGQEVDLIPTIIDFIEVNQQLDKLVKGKIDTLLASVISNPDSIAALLKLEDAKLKSLREYINQSEIANSKSGILIEAEYARRYKFVEDDSEKIVQIKNAARTESVTQPVRVENTKHHVPEPTKKNGPPTNAANSSTLELFLIAVLILVVLIILVEIFILFSPFLFDKIWGPFKPLFQ